ncbi:MAG TPA: hypothetical protein DCW68_06795 [Rhodospirillaceae bacterium]|nr:MAG: hypothetical protein A2018_01305 [Alphaproteobacteria bacterium GWF2_58_20]HAU29795.1 hypothetical protein [Rhodospirillaceae bacterium]
MFLRRAMKCARRWTTAPGDILTKGNVGYYYAGTGPSMAPWERLYLPYSLGGAPVYCPRDRIWICAGSTAYLRTANMVDDWTQDTATRSVYGASVLAWCYLRGCVFILENAGILVRLYRLSGDDLSISEIVWSMSWSAGIDMTMGCAGGSIYILGDRNLGEDNDLVLVRSADIGETWSHLTAPQSAVEISPLQMDVRENGGKAFVMLTSTWPVSGDYSTGTRLWSGDGAWSDITPSGWLVDGEGLIPVAFCPHAGIVVVLILQERSDGAFNMIHPRFAVRGSGGGWSTITPDLETVLGELPAGTFWLPDSPIWPDRWTGYAVGHPFRIGPIGDAIHCTARFRGWDGTDYTEDVGYAHGWTVNGTDWTWETFTPGENDDTWHFWAGKYTPT